MLIGTRIDTTGEILDPGGINISIEPEDQGLPSITFGGAYYFVAWGDSRENQIYGSRVSPDGVVLDSLGIIIADTLNLHHLKSCLTSDGANYLVSWYNSILFLGNRGHYGSRINQNGEILDTIEMFTSSDPYIWPSRQAFRLLSSSFRPFWSRSPSFSFESSLPWISPALLVFRSMITTIECASFSFVF